MNQELAVQVDATPLPLVTEHGHPSGAVEPPRVGVLHNGREVLGRYDARQKLLEWAASRGRQQLSLTLSDLPGLSIHTGNPQRPGLQLICAGDVDLSLIPHPLEQVLPHLGPHSYVETAIEEGARILYRDQRLRVPGRGDGADETTQLSYLGRHVTKAKDARGGRRFVEPGVGRTCLVDFIRLEGAPEFEDFAASGVGLTPYSEHGFVGVGRAVDGLVALKRAEHRRKVAERLEAGACRAARVVAIIERPGRSIAMLDGSSSPAVIVIRGFRTVLRVKQLDPVAAFYHSSRHAAWVASALLEECLSAHGSSVGRHGTAERAAAAAALAHGFERHGAARDDLRRLLAGHGSGAAFDPLRWATERARVQRLKLITQHAPPIIQLLQNRIGRQLGRPPLSRPEYLAWFTRTLGSQLARTRRLRFLHDYHHPGVSRYRPDWLYTLTENNVTLAAEFADLETGVFVDDDPSSLSDALQLSPADIQVLRSGYERFHQRDLEEAREVAHSVARVLELIDPNCSTKDAMAQFDAGYLEST
jgi:hypothetical protein